MAREWEAQKLQIVQFLSEEQVVVNKVQDQANFAADIAFSRGPKALHLDSYHFNHKSFILRAKLLPVNAMSLLKLSTMHNKIPLFSSQIQTQ